MTTIKEAVDNSLDACEEGEILPEISVEIIDMQNDRFKVIIEDENGNVLNETVEGAPLGLPDNPNAVIKVDTGKKFIGKTHA